MTCCRFLVEAAFCWNVTGREMPLSLESGIGLWCGKMLYPIDVHKFKNRIIMWKTTRGFFHSTVKINRSTANVFSRRPDLIA